MSDPRLNALKHALQLEKDGMAFYQGSRDKATSDIGRAMFEYLRKSEEGHIRRIRDIWQSLEQSGDWPAQPPERTDADSAIGTIFSNALNRLKQQQTLDTDDIQALEQAAEFERAGEDFYRQRAEAVTDPLERNFYHQLAREEFRHLQAIEDTLLMLKDPQGFFADREHGTLAN